MNIESIFKGNMERVGNPYVRGGGGGGGGELKLGGIEADFIEIICRQVLGGCLKLSAYFAKSKEFLRLYHKTQCILNIESIFKGNVTGKVLSLPLYTPLLIVAPCTK